MRKIQNAELERLTVDDFKQSEKQPVIIVLDNVRSLNNIGSIFRTADAFRCNAIYICGISACPPHREIHKTALGAEDSVDWQYFQSTEAAIEKLKQDGNTIIAVEQAEKGIALDKFIPQKGKKYALVFGHEINGVSENVMHMCDLAIDIPQHGTKHSLNVSICAGIIIWWMHKNLSFQENK
jgi:23S rRNA (guanosine2251-2'-O)-methyltransferase